MTVALDSDEVDGLEAVPAWLIDDHSAGWWARAGAFGIDVLAGATAVAAVLLVGWSTDQRGLLWWSCILVAALLVVAIAANRFLLPASTGWTLGRALFGITVVDRDGSRPTLGRLLLRDLAHLLDTVPLFLGWLWPLIDRRGRTFADIVVGTEVRQSHDPRPDWRRLTARVIAAAAAVSLLAAVLGYVLIYRPQSNADRARDQIADAGPKIVVDMLSYTAATVTDDFVRAQNLVTDSYRPELMKQQDAVRKAPVDNDYWVANSAVQSSSADRASMLLLLQGQRGASPNQRFVTASVRAEFEKTGRDTWKLSNLTVLATPKSAGADPKPAEGAPKPEGAAPKPAAPKPGAAAPKPAAPKPGAATPKPTPAPKSTGAQPAPKAPGEGGR